MSPRSIATTGLVATLITAGCASGAGAQHGSTSQPDSAGAGTLAVMIAMYGGPMRPDGHMALNGSPATMEPVQVRDARGRVWQATTGSSGRAVFTVPGGRYRVSSSYCGIPATVTLAAGSARTATLQCDVP